MFCFNWKFINGKQTNSVTLVSVSVEGLSDGRYVTLGELSRSHWCTHRIYAKQTESYLCTLMMQGFKSLALEFSVWCCVMVWVSRGTL